VNVIADLFFFLIL
jgi:hypothetical protein